MERGRPFLIHVPRVVAREMQRWANMVSNWAWNDVKMGASFALTLNTTNPKKAARQHDTHTETQKHRKRGGRERERDKKRERERKKERERERKRERETERERERERHIHPPTHANVASCRRSAWAARARQCQSGRWPFGSCRRLSSCGAKRFIVGFLVVPFCCSVFVKGVF